MSAVVVFFCVLISFVSKDAETGIFMFNISTIIDETYLYFLLICE